MVDFLIAVGSLAMIVGAFVALFWKGKRRKGLIAIGVGFALGLTGGALSSGDVSASKAAGFDTPTEYRTAKAAGYDTAEAYHAAQKAEAEKKRAEAAARAEQDRLQKEAADKTCKADLKCWAEKYRVEAAVSCVPLIERMAKYDLRWTDGMLEPKFSHYRWQNRETGVLTYIGDKIQLQNGFGAWSNMIYECDYSPRADKVTDIRLRSGRI